MLKQLVLLTFASGLCLGVSCTITGPGGGGTTSGTPLDQATATIAIGQTVGDTQASVMVTIVDDFGRTIMLTDERNVTVDDQTLSGPVSGVYSATITADGQYTITVREPTRGVETTTVDAPAEFAITAPDAGGTASLSGFTLVWTNADATLTADITLRQTFAGTTTTEQFGPVVDAGVFQFSAADLRNFVQGVDLEITVVKTGSTSNIAGFDSSTVTAQVTGTRSASPLP
jgi:hypothetical protein